MTLEQITALTYKQLKDEAKRIGVNPVGKAMDVLRNEVFEELNAGTAPAAATTPAPAETPAPSVQAQAQANETPAPEASTSAPEATLIPDNLTPEEKEALRIKNEELDKERAKISAEMGAKQAEMDKLKEALKVQQDALKAEVKKLADAEEAMKKEIESLSKVKEKEEAKSAKAKEKAELKAAKEKEKEEARIAKEKELAVVYEKGTRVQVDKGGKLVTADVIATDIYDARSGFSFYRFRRLLIDPTDNSEVAGGYFFKRNYTIPQKGGNGNEAATPSAGATTEEAPQA